MKIDKESLKKNAIKTGLDALAIVVVGIGAMASSEFIPALEELEIFVAVAGGIWLYVPLRGLIEKLRK